jgi:nitroimidazol reductase NimA-like FMN-containing flavoprotein (pyridoxamine 5'-phosphate oxidase superfamily)
VEEKSAMLEKMKELIRSQDICVLATACDNEPHCSLMAYVIDDHCREIYMVTHRSTAKFRNATKNPNVSLLIDTRLEDEGERRQRARALTVTGLFERIENPERREAIRARLLKRHAHLRDFAAHPEAEVFAVKILALQLLDGITDSYYERLA